MRVLHKEDVVGRKASQASSFDIIRKTRKKFMFLRQWLPIIREKTMSSGINSSSPWGPEQKGAPNLTSVANLLKESSNEKQSIKNVVILAGAGISTTSGIPDFRSPKTGLYANLKKYNLPFPEAIFDINYFQQKPQPFFTLSKEMWPSNFQPTLTHSFFTLLDKKQKLLRVFTQNIDTLERLANLSSDRIIEAHGSFAQSRCIRCKKQVDQEWMKEKVMSGEVVYCPSKGCSKFLESSNKNSCLVKPDIVFFGEGLPDKFFQSLGDLKKADLLLVIGTSLQVHPFASLVDYVKPSCPRVLINLERVGEIASYDGAGSGMRGLMNESGFDFEGWTLPKGKGKEMIRDVFWQGKCDEGILQLAKELGWESELRELHKETCKQIVRDNNGEKSAEKLDQSLEKSKAEVDKVAGEIASEMKPTESENTEKLADELEKLNIASKEPTKDEMEPSKDSSNTTDEPAKKSAASSL